MKLFPSLQWAVPRHFCKHGCGQAGDGILQPPPPCQSAECSLQEEEAGGSPCATSLNTDNGIILLLKWHSCLLLVHNLLDEAFDLPEKRCISRDGCPCQADSTALQSQILAAQPRFFCHGSLPILLTSPSKISHSQHESSWPWSQTGAT